MSDYLEHRRNLKLHGKEDKTKSGKGKLSKLSAWYKTIMEKEKPVCWETKEKIDGFMFHASVAHLLPKALFPSVATHKSNYAILSAQNGSHSKYDQSWQRAATMKIWPYALKVIIKELVPKLTREERRRLPDIIQQEINPLKSNSR